jgi:hypothetical protein
VRDLAHRRSDCTAHRDGAEGMRAQGRASAPRTSCGLTRVRAPLLDDPVAPAQTPPAPARRRPRAQLQDTRARETTTTRTLASAPAHASLSAPATRIRETAEIVEKQHNAARHQGATRHAGAIVPLVHNSGTFAEACPAALSRLSQPSGIFCWRSIARAVVDYRRLRCSQRLVTVRGSATGSPRRPSRGVRACPVVWLIR